MKLFEDEGCTLELETLHEAAEFFPSSWGMLHMILAECEQWVPFNVQTSSINPLASSDPGGQRVGVTSMWEYRRRMRGNERWEFAHLGFRSIIIDVRNTFVGDDPEELKSSCDTLLNMVEAVEPHSQTDHAVAIFLY